MPGRRAALGPYPTYDPLPLPKPTKLAIRKKEANYTRVKGGKRGKTAPLSPLSFILRSSHFYLFPFGPGGIQWGQKGDMEDPNVGESIIGFKMDINNMQCYHIE